MNQRIQKHRQRMLAIAKNHGAKNVRVFGSAVRGDMTAKSDVDLLVSFGPNATLLTLVALKQDMEEFLGCSVDVLTEDGISPYIKRNVLSEAQPL